MGILAAHTPGDGSTYSAERAPPDSQMDRGAKLLRVPKRLRSFVVLKKRPSFPSSLVHMSI